MNTTNKYEAVIGLEVHAQLKTKTKAYSNDENIYGASKAPSIFSNMHCNYFSSFMRHTIWAILHSWEHTLQS